MPAWVIIGAAWSAVYVGLRLFLWKLEGEVPNE